MNRLLILPVLLLTLLVGTQAFSADYQTADYQKGLTAYESGDYATALREWTPLAAQGNALAAFQISLMYIAGRGVPKDDSAFAYWSGLAAKQGFGLDQFEKIQKENKKRQRENKKRQREKKEKAESKLAKIRAKENRKGNLKDNYGFKELRLGMSIKDINPNKIKGCRVGVSDRELNKPTYYLGTTIYCYKKKIRIRWDNGYLEKIGIEMGPMAGMPSTKTAGGIVGWKDWRKLRNILSKKYKENFTFSDRDIDLFNRSDKILYTVFESGAVALEVDKQKLNYIPQPHLKVVYRGRETAKKFFNRVKPQAELKAKDF